MSELDEIRVVANRINGLVDAASKDIARCEAALAESCVGINVSVDIDARRAMFFDKLGGKWRIGYYETRGAGEPLSVPWEQAGRLAKRDIAALLPALVSAVLRAARRLADDLEPKPEQRS